MISFYYEDKHLSIVIVIGMHCFNADTCGFKASTQKKDPELQMLLCNLHLQKIRVQELLPNGKWLCVWLHV